VENIKLDFGEIGWGGVDWFDLDQERALVNTVMNLRVPRSVGKSLSGCTTGGISRRDQLQGVRLYPGMIHGQFPDPKRGAGMIRSRQ
jgi:hypothetical protein